MVAFVFFRTGSFLASGDIAPMVVDGLQAELGWQWTHQTTGAGGPTYEIARAAEVVGARLGVLLGGTEALGQRLLFSAIWAFAAAAVAALAARFTRRGGLAALIGIGGAVNLFTLIAQPNPLPILTIGVCAATLTFAVDAARTGRARWAALALVSVPCSYLSLNPPLLAVVLVTVVLGPVVAPVLTGTGLGGVRRVLRMLVLSALPAAGAAAWWTVPAVIAISRADPTAKGAVTDVEAWSWTHMNSSLLNVASLVGHWSWPRPEYYGSAVVLERWPWYALRFVPTVAVVAAVVVVPAARRRAAVLVALAVAALTVVGKGLHEPFSGLNHWLYREVPGFWLLREPVAKVGVLLVVCFALAAALCGDALFDRADRLAGARHRAERSRLPGVLRALAVALVVAPLIGVWPLWSGAVIATRTDDRPGDRVALPSAWREIASLVNASPRSGKVLVLPVNDFYQQPTTWGYYGADNLVRRLITRPVLISDPQLYVGDTAAFEALMRSVEQNLAVDRGEGTDALLASLGVSHVIVRKDFDYSSTIRRPDMRRPEPLLAGLEQVPGVRRVAGNEMADVFEVTGATTGAVEALSGVVKVGDLSPTGLALLRSVVPDHVGLVTGDVMPALQVGRALVRYGNDPAVEVTVGEEGRWTVSRRAASEPAMRIQAIGSVIEAEEFVRWKIGDRAGLPAARQLIPVPGLAAVRVGDRLLDEQSGAMTVRADTATMVQPWLYSDPRNLTGPRSGVLDCNNLGPLLPAELGHRATDRPDDTVELAALRHSACLRWPVMGVQPGRTYQVTLDGRSLAGRNPRVCLWQVGPDRCADLDPRTSADGRSLNVSTLWTAPAGTTAASVYVYADGPLDMPGEGPGPDPTTDASADASTDEALDTSTDEALDGFDPLTAELPPGAAGPATPGTVTRYSPPRVVAVRAGTPVALRLTPPTRAEITLAPGRHEVEAEQSAGLPTVGRPGPVRDCHRYDRRSIKEVGISSRIEADRTLTLRASDHAACSVVTIGEIQGAMPYLISFEHRTVKGMRARYCVFDRRAGQCLRQGQIEDSGSQWRRFEIDVNAPKTAESLDLYLYADSEGRTTETQYRRIGAKPMVDEYLALVRADTSVPAPPELSWKQLSPARYRVRVSQARAPFVLALSDSWSADWRVSNAPDDAVIEHVRIDGYRNGWAVDAVGDLDLLVEYVPSRAGQRAIRVSVATGVAVVLLVATQHLLRRRRRLAAGRDDVRRMGPRERRSRSRITRPRP